MDKSPKANMPNDETIEVNCVSVPFTGRNGNEFQTQIAFNGLLTNKILTALPGIDFAHLLAYLEPVSISAGQHIYDFGEPIEHIYFPETAVVSHLHFLENGSTTAAAMVGKEGVVGLSAILDSRPAAYWTQVTLGGTAIRVRPEIIRKEFARGAAMQRLVLEYTRNRLTQLSQRAVCNGRHRLRERLSTWLLMIHDRVGSEEFSLTQETIAHHVGGRRAGISTACTELGDLGVLNHKRGRLRIVRRDLLERAACECYKTLCQHS